VKHRPEDSAADKPKFSSRNLGVISAATALTIAIFVLFPFTQFIGNQTRELVTLRSIDVAPPPPPPPSEELPPDEPPVEEAPPPDLSETPPPLDLAQLEMALNPGMGDDFSNAFSIAGFDVASDTASEIMTFEISDLDEMPRMLKGSRPKHPPNLLRERVEGIVRLKVLLDETGRVIVQSVLSSTNSSFERPAIQAAEDFRYTPPTKNGEPARTEFVLPIKFSIS
jgi:protein TonB